MSFLLTEDGGSDNTKKKKVTGGKITDVDETAYEWYKQQQAVGFLLGIVKRLYNRTFTQPRISDFLKRLRLGRNHLHLIKCVIIDI
jgi:hypothetical protein